MFARWHGEAGVRPYLLDSRGTVVGYGEIWEDPVEGEAELARILIDPAARGRGLGRAFVTLLAAEARRLGWESVWLRVMPDNEAALRSYAGAGFLRASLEEETAFNEGQPEAYVWMHAPNPPEDLPDD